MYRSFLFSRIIPNSYISFHNSTELKYGQNYLSLELLTLELKSFQSLPKLCHLQVRKLQKHKFFLNPEEFFKEFKVLSLPSSQVVIHKKNCFVHKKFLPCVLLEVPTAVQVAQYDIP